MSPMVLGSRFLPGHGCLWPQLPGLRVQAPHLYNILSILNRILETLALYVFL